MTLMLVTTIILCISHNVYSNIYNKSLGIPDDMVDCIFAINPQSITFILNLKWHSSEQYIQNIGKTSVEITAGKNTFSVHPLQTKMLPSVNNIYLKIFVSKTLKRAIIYLSKCINCGSLNIKDIQKHLNKINVVKKTFTVGVENIPKDHLNLQTVISYFWPQNKANIWQQLYEVIQQFLNSFNRKNFVYKFIEEDIEEIKKDIVALSKSNVTDFANKYMNIFNKINFSENFYILETMVDFYVFPVYTNTVKMQLYLFAMGIANPQHNIYLHLREVAKRRFCRACGYIKYMQTYIINELYNTVYAPGLFNVLMNAYSYIAFHGLQLFSIWEEISEYLGKSECTECKIGCPEPITYSTSYGKATPNLLGQAIHIDTSPLAAYCEQNGGKAAKLNSILFYIRSENKRKTVYGLSLMFSSNFSTTMGASQTSKIIERQDLFFANSTIIKLKVYRTVFIRCLEFTWANDTSTTVGNSCGHVFRVFQLKDHYINSLYLANDYSKTEEYFDNIAVSFLPNSL